MSRETVVIPEKKRKIEKIKKKFNNPEMSDSTATKIASLEVTNNLLKAATITAGVVTVIDLFVPDPVFGLDEAALASITGLLKLIVLISILDILKKQEYTSFKCLRESMNSSQEWISSESKFDSM